MIFDCDQIEFKSKLLYIFSLI